MILLRITLLGRARINHMSGNAGEGFTSDFVVGQIQIAGLDLLLQQG
jgi:hypothetical protein